LNVVAQGALLMCGVYPTLSGPLQIKLFCDPCNRYFYTSSVIASDKDKPQGMATVS